MQYRGNQEEADSQKVNAYRQQAFDLLTMLNGIEEQKVSTHTLISDSDSDSDSISIYGFWTLEQRSN